MYNEIDFRHSSVEDKIIICNKTQGILKAYFPDSEYTLHKNNLPEGIKFYKKLIDDFKGCCIMDSSAIIFYKKVEVADQFNRNGEYQRVKDLAHNPNGNCLFIDFLVANFNDDNVEDLKEFFFRDQNIELFMMLRRGEVILKPRRDLEVIAKRVSTYSLISSLAS
jgi:hypothetical protein